MRWLVLAGAAFASCGPLPAAEFHPVPDAAEPSHSSTFPLELRRVADARRLPILADVRIHEVSRRELLSEAMRQVDGEAPELVLRERAYVLEVLGLVPAGFDFRAALAALLERTLVGLYDPFGARVLVAQDSRGRDAATTRYHELGHALVDQHFDLRSRVRYRELDADRHAALSALSEGDASSLMFDLAALDQGIRRSALVDDFVSGVEAAAASDTEVPSVVSRLLAAPYLDGLAFMEELRARGGWDAVNEVWRHPPDTSEQLLHPEAYSRGERARALPAFSSPNPSCRRVYSDVLGEQTLGCLAAEWIGPEAAREAFTGWGADLFTTFECEDGKALMIALAGDDGPALQRMVAAFDAGARGRGCGALDLAGQTGPAAVAFVYSGSSRCPRLVPGTDTVAGSAAPR